MGINDLASHQPEVRDRRQEVRDTTDLKLYQAAFKGDWDTAQVIFSEFPDKIYAQITQHGETALHIATAAQRTYFVEQLVNMMSPERLMTCNNAGSTAFWFVSVSGTLKLAQLMMTKNRALPMVRGAAGTLPIHIAASLGHREMVSWLYDETKDELDDGEHITLLVILIDCDIYDIALQMLKACPRLARVRDKNKETALHALARNPRMPSNIAQQSRPGIWNKCIRFGSKKSQKKMDELALELVQYLWQQVLQLDDSSISELIESPWSVIFTAAEHGNVEFLNLLIYSYPDVIFKVDRQSRSIFHIAVLYRQEGIFKLIHEIGSIKNLIAAYVDDRGNNMLHLAGMLRPPSRFNARQTGERTSAAVQMQLELVWFEEVKKVVAPQYIEAKNADGLSPGELFVREHKLFMKESEVWVRESSNQSMVVATLIATVVFAAAFTVPGGNGQDTGIPILLHEISFKLFAISDAISFIFSTSSILTFLSISSSSYDEYDFLCSFPNKLIIGFGTLFVSIAAMMIAFIAAFFIIFKAGQLKFAIPISVIASLPVVLFIRQQRRLFVDMVRAIRMSKSLAKPSKRLHSKSKWKS